MSRTLRRGAGAARLGVPTSLLTARSFVACSPFSPCADEERRIWSITRSALTECSDLGRRRLTSVPRPRRRRRSASPRSCSDNLSKEPMVWTRYKPCGGGRTDTDAQSAPLPNTATLGRLSTVGRRYFWGSISSPLVVPRMFTLSVPSSLALQCGRRERHTGVTTENTIIDNNKEKVEHDGENRVTRRQSVSCSAGVAEEELHHHHHHDSTRTSETASDTVLKKEGSEEPNDNDGVPWETRMARLYGEGNYGFFRALYKELCEEMKRELYTKPPSAYETTQSPGNHHEQRKPHPQQQEEGEGEKELRGQTAPAGAASSSSSPRWTVKFHAITNTLVFERPPLRATRAAAKSKDDITAPNSSSPPSSVSSNEPTKGTATETELTSRVKTLKGVAESSSRTALGKRMAEAKRAEAASESAHVIAYTRVAVQDPPKMNALLTFADWTPIEVFVSRNDVILHFSIACNEGGLHMRNLRMYDANASWKDTLALKETYVQKTRGVTGAEQESSINDKRENETIHDVLFGAEVEADVVAEKDRTAGPARFENIRHLLYDGPCLWHLELDLQNELYDVMQDYGIHVDWVRWVSEWVFYYEHRLTVRWMCGVLLELVPPSKQGTEEDFLTAEERAELDLPASDWVREPAC